MLVKERRQLIITKIKDKWCVYCSKKAVSKYFNTKAEAIEYKQYMVSR